MPSRFQIFILDRDGWTRLTSLDDKKEMCRIIRFYRKGPRDMGVFDCRTGRCHFDEVEHERKK